MRICSGPGCLRSIPDGVRFCDECKPVTAQTDDIREHHSGYSKEIDRLVQSERWRRLRRSVIKQCPICARCDLHFSEEVDHIVPAQFAIEQARASGMYLDKYAGYFFRSNLQALCRKCHRAKTLEDKMHVGGWPDVVAQERSLPKKRYVL